MSDRDQNAIDALKGLIESGQSSYTGTAATAILDAIHAGRVPGISDDAIVPTSEMFTSLAEHGCGAIASFVAMCDLVDSGDLEYLPDEHNRMGYRISQQAIERRGKEVEAMVGEGK